MRVLGNIIWLIFGGSFLAIAWFFIGILLCITIIGIPFGIQAFKMASLTLTPFGKRVTSRASVGSVLMNIIWIICVGLWLTLGYVISGFLCCITIIGIPFGIQSFKIAGLALCPFGAVIEEN